MKPTFTLSISIDATLGWDEIWPDGDAPENPTCDDVRAVFLGKNHRPGASITRQIEDWNLDPTDRDIFITDDRKMNERLERLAAAKR